MKWNIFVLCGLLFCMTPVSAFGRTVDSLGIEICAEISIKKELFSNTTTPLQLFFPFLQKIVDHGIVEKKIYTYATLSEGAEKLWEESEVLGIEGIIQRTDALEVVTTEEWSEEKQQEVKDFLRIENIEFQKLEEGQGLVDQ